MFQFLSVLFGLAAILPMIPGLIPFFGWIQWLTLVLVVIGLIFGSFCERKIGRNINLAVGVVAVLRLLLGGGGF